MMCDLRVVARLAATFHRPTGRTPFSEPQHRLRDALVVYLRDHPKAYEEVLRSRPDGPLAISYVRGPASNRTPDRFDYLMVSDDVAVLEVTYAYQEALAIGSDHAFVRGRFNLN